MYCRDVSRSDDLLKESVVALFVSESVMGSERFVARTERQSKQPEFQTKLRFTLPAPISAQARVRFGLYFSESNNSSAAAAPPSDELTASATIPIRSLLSNVPTDGTALSFPLTNASNGQPLLNKQQLPSTLLLRIAKATGPAPVIATATDSAASAASSASPKAAAGGTKTALTFGVRCVKLPVLNLLGGSGGASGSAPFVALYASDADDSLEFASQTEQQPNRADSGAVVYRTPLQVSEWSSVDRTVRLAVYDHDIKSSGSVAERDESELIGDWNGLLSALKAEGAGGVPLIRDGRPLKDCRVTLTALGDGGRSVADWQSEADASIAAAAKPTVRLDAQYALTVSATGVSDSKSGGSFDSWLVSCYRYDAESSKADFIARTELSK